MCGGGCGSAQGNANPGACQNRFGGMTEYDDSGSGLVFTGPILPAPATVVVPAVTELAQTGVVTVGSQMLGYQDLFTGLDADGNPARVVYPGSFGQLYQANKAGA
jgi:hypothetical protein